MKKVVFITGISSGFGYEISKVLASNGYTVYGTIRRKCIVPDGVVPLFMELTQPETIRNAVQQIILTEGKIDVLINNAGMHSGGPIEQLSEPVFREQFETNVIGLIHVLQNVLPSMRMARSGLILNISSIGGLTGLPFQGIYSASKFAIEGLSQALRMELKAFNIKVIVINPGDFRTNNTANRFKSYYENGGYDVQFQRSLAIIEKDEQGGLNAGILAKKVLKIIASKHPANRYVIASFIQKLAVLVKKIIPESWFYKIIANHYNVKSN